MGYKELKLCVVKIVNMYQWYSNGSNLQVQYEEKEKKKQKGI